MALIDTLVRPLRPIFAMKPSRPLILVLVLLTVGGELFKWLGPGETAVARNEFLSGDQYFAVNWPVGGLVVMGVCIAVAWPLKLYRLLSCADVAKLSELFSTSAIFVLLLEDFLITCWTPASLDGCVNDSTFTNHMFNCNDLTTVLGTDCTEDQVALACDLCPWGFVPRWGIAAYMEIISGVVTLVFFDNLEEGTLPSWLSQTFFLVLVFLATLANNLFWSLFQYNYDEVGSPGIQLTTISFVATSRFIVQILIIFVLYNEWEKHSQGEGKVVPAATGSSTVITLQSLLEEEAAQRQAIVDEVLAGTAGPAARTYTNAFERLARRRALLEDEFTALLAEVEGA